MLKSYTMKGLELDDSPYSGKETFNIEQRLAREKGVDLIGVDPKTLSFSERLRQRNQQRNARSSHEDTDNEPSTTQINVYEESNGQMVVIVPPGETSVLFVGTTSSSNDTTVHFRSIDQEIREIMADVDSPEIEYPREYPILVLPRSKRVLRTPYKRDNTEGSPIKIKPKKRQKENRTGEYIRVEPTPIPEGYLLLHQVVTPEDYKAMRQGGRYSDLLTRDEKKRVLIKIADIPEALRRRNSYISDEALTPDHQLLYTFATNEEEKVALQEAASHERIPAIRKSNGWFAKPDVAREFLESRKATDPNQRPMTTQEVVRYRDFLKSGDFPARKIKNRWHTSDKEISEFEEANPSKRKVNLPNS